MFKSINGGKLPTKATKFSAGVDVYANEDVVINAGETKIISLGIKLDIDFIKKMFINDIDDYYLAIDNFSKKEVWDCLQNDGFFEFEMYNGKILTEDVFIEMEQNEDYADYYRVIYDRSRYKTFMQTHYISLKPRSSLRAKGLISHTGVIDLDYKDEIKMIIYNPIPNGTYKIKKGDRIGQLLLIQHEGYLFGIESEEERSGGLGSTGN